MTMQTLPMPATPAPTRIFGSVGTAALRLVNMVRAYKNRRDLEVLAAFDDRMLRDIGLTRGDLRDAVAEPLWRDPSAVLVTRVRERRTAALRFSRTLFEIARMAQPASPKNIADAPSVAPADDTSSRLFPARSRYY